MRLPVNQVAPLAAVVFLAACASGGGGALQSVDRAGPAADYPMVIGAPFTIDGVTWTPADTMNYDQVGHASVEAGAAGISAAHRTLPLPSYAEVTSLETGRTILVRIERRGPMDNGQLIALSPAAVAQIGATADRLPVRVRRVNPPEPERALLRSGQPAPARMDTPKSLVAVLARKLSPQPSATPANLPAVAAPAPEASASPDRTPSAVPKAPVAGKPPAQPVPPAPGRAEPPAARPLVIQVAAFSTRERAEASARRTGGEVSPVGKLWRVRKGPFSTRSEAEAALARVRSAGYGDARILRAD